MLKFCTTAYTPKGTPDSAQRNIMSAGRPSVLFVRWLRHTCGASWMHQNMVPMVPNTVAEIGIEV